MLKKHFSRFLEADPERLHFAAHSHHYWPDVTEAAQREAWELAARRVDDKWDEIFGSVWTEAQGHVARVLQLPDPKTLAFAPNTHEFYLRILSCLPAGKVHRILTTDGEFHSFARQTARLEEDGLVAVTRFATRPFETVAERFRAAASAEAFDLVYLSQVFFDSGFAVPELETIARAAHPSSLVVVDGYHGFMAVETHLGPIADRIFYLAGGYKYAMAGEGCCFLHAPPGVHPRPRDTGWYAAFFALGQAQGGAVPYGDGGARFLGATFDPTALFRFNAVQRWLGELGVGVPDIVRHTRALQERFIAALPAGSRLRASDLVVPLATQNRGQFLTFQTPDAAELHRLLAAEKLVTDVRGDRLRFGFALYHDDADVDRGVERIARALGGQAR